MKIFGDDGFRDITFKGLMDKKFLNDFFIAINFFLKEKNIKSKIFIGYDTRNTNKQIIELITTNIKIVKNIKIFKIPVTTPYCHFISQKEKTFVIMITASHFRYNYNGFKFFLNGSKLNFKDERLIINNLQNKNVPILRKNNTKVTKNFLNDYQNYINNNFNLKINKNVLFDYSNGAAASFINKINFLKKCNKINFKYNGRNINLNCGSEYLHKNINLFTKKNHLAFAFDGDADRVLIGKKNYGIIETEKIALIFAIYLKQKYKNFKKFSENKTIIGTIITNPWLKKQLSEEGFGLKLSRVGDRNVINKIKKNKALFGFETSGHFSFNNTMDGIFTAGMFLRVLRENPSLIDEILKKEIDYKKLIFVIKKTNLKRVVKKLLFLKKNLKIKVIVRKSIWSKDHKIYIFYKKSLKKILMKKIYNKVILKNVEKMIK
ncbi:hypothetical protein OA187_02185 [Candidatus Pelagibacter sp.]|nr:hypothetical protein [Candidatus Pelagibacter sp.]